MTKRKRTDTTAPELPLPSPATTTPSPPEQGGDPERDNRDIAGKLRKQKQKRGKTPSGERGPA